MTGMGDIPRELVALFEPQVEQLGVRLERRGGIWVGEARGSVATGSMWLCAPMPYCLVLCHDVTPLEDMPLFEGSLGPYACACTMGDDAVACSRDCGLPIRLVGAGVGARHPRDEVATFVEHGPRSLSSHLLACRVYRSRSIICLPDFFDELDRSYPGEFGGLFSAFDSVLGPEAKGAIRHALGTIPASPPLGPGGSLGLLSTVTSLMASLAADGRGAEQDEDALVSHARMLLSAAVEEGGAPPSVNELARRLYVSRSRLCDAFRSETGRSVGAYARQLRMERARHLLEDGNRSVAEVAVLLGYPSPSAFCHAFTGFTGMSPRAWAKGHDPF
ncbi:MAG TPA: helix-turn-helix transcriptional regulator [Candidatus Olsenella stercoravium]|uniref:Helix-turn-helix transcriptional regulator n=1 Tax=Candidatus Olsenella stercoravium TaxID=2838713 RepID=A0A9D2DJ87_9ACTN|nr:helix-turn-helix transcriptional regulator [Candidatus Olsenella stercoravium]